MEEVQGRGGRLGGAATGSGGNGGGRIPAAAAGTMFRNQYDTDITTYSPQGRLHQVEYAMEAVKQGSASVGVRSKTHVVLATLKRFASELSGDQKKLFAIDDHVVIAISGLTADARVLSRYMRTETQHHKFMYDEPMPVGRLVLQVADKCQVCAGSGARGWCCCPCR